MKHKPFTAARFLRAELAALRASAAIIKYRSMIVAQRSIMGEEDFLEWAREHGFKDADNREF